MAVKAGVEGSVGAGTDTDGLTVAEGPLLTGFVLADSGE